MKKALKSAVVEKDVENAYREGIRKARPKAEITSPHKTDGLVKWDRVRLLLEAKYDLQLKERIPACNALGQCLLYLKKFEQSGAEHLPNVILVGDKNECFVLSTACVQNFLNLPIDWSVAPSAGHPELTRALVAGLNILPYVYDVDDHFDFREVLTKVEVLAEGAVHSIKATPGNIGAIFVYWRDRVFTGNSLTAVEQVDVFLKCLFQPGEVGLHRAKRGVLEVPGYPGGVTVNSEQYKSFFEQFQQGYKPSEIETFYAMKDRLIEDDARRRQGAFFTPVLFVNQAHRMIEAELGDKWRDECIIWDNSCGTGNLTRDYAFKDLILSTAEKPDIEVIRNQGYNPGAEVFAYDFLNDDSSPFFEGKNEIPDSVDNKLRAASAAGKRLVFFLNPPYGTANDAGAAGTSKKGIALTSVNAEMKQAKIGPSSQQLYAQFMFRCAKLAQKYGFKKHTVALFSVPTFMCSGSYRKFREFWYKQFEYKSGMLFQASHFADVSAAWGISFTVWNSEGQTSRSAQLSIILKDVKSFSVESTGSKSLYNSDGREASEWVRQEIKGVQGVDAPQLSSGLKVKGEGRGSMQPGALGFFGNNANNLCDSATMVYLVSSADTRNNGLSVVSSNFLKVCALYAARKLVENTWINHVDEYLAPLPEIETSDAYKQWNADAVIYALFHNKNNCTAMRNVSYKSKLWRIKNNFWWKTLEESRELYDTASTPNLYADIRGEAQDSYLATILPQLKPLLSPEATECLNLADKLLALSLPHRENYAAGKLELHLMTHDSGTYQLKHLFRDLFPTEWKEFQKSFNNLADKLRPGVYILGWLKK